MSESPKVTPSLPDIDTGVEFVYDETAELDPPHHVIVHNDEVTPFDFVIAIIRSVFELPHTDAYRVTLEAHTRGKACVTTLSFEEAKYRVYRAHAIARARGYPLTFSLEPAN